MHPTNVVYSRSQEYVRLIRSLPAWLFVGLLGAYISGNLGLWLNLGVLLSWAQIWEHLAFVGVAWFMALPFFIKQVELARNSHLSITRVAFRVRDDSQFQGDFEWQRICKVVAGLNNAGQVVLITVFISGEDEGSITIRSYEHMDEIFARFRAHVGVPIVVKRVGLMWTQRAMLMVLVVILLSSFALSISIR
jgi:hypothetical protein